MVIVMTNWILIAEIMAFAWLATAVLFVRAQHKWSQKQTTPVKDEVVRSIQASAGLAFPVWLALLFGLTIYQAIKLF
jgi:hypothetical protein